MEENIIFKAGFWCTNESPFSYVIVIHDNKTTVIPTYKKSKIEFFSLNMQS